MTRQSYHTSLKELVFHNLLPEKFIKKIPTSNFYRWKNDNYDRYVGSEINQIADEHTELNFMVLEMGICLFQLIHFTRSIVCWKSENIKVR